FANKLIRCFVPLAGENDVIQNPSIIFTSEGHEAHLKCRHTKGDAFFQMYWYRQRHQESLTLIVNHKFSVNKTVPESGSFTVNDLDSMDNAVYFCAVSKHSAIITVQSYTKTHCACMCDVE
uniref:Ig-like domain-containing protein n=1 Tax=Electrophorus electricus TaxID=8005 RepID=A0A4W4EGM3_ELEEL